MTRFVILEPSADTDVSLGFDVRLGPLAFVCVADALDETLGEALEAVGAVLTPAEPRPRPLKIVLPIRGTGRELDPRETGYRIRRQVRQLLENPRWLASGLFFHWEADPELDCWLRFGGGDVQDTDPGVTFGEWRLELTDCYRVGTAGQTRLGRRLELGDRRTGLVALDTRGLLYSTDHAAQALPTEPLIIPGDVTATLLTYNRPPSSFTLGPQRGIRRLWREVAAADGEVASFLPDEAALPDAGRQYLDLEDFGAVRVWDLSGSTVNVGDPSNWTNGRDTDPTIMGWERVLGPMVRSRAPQLAVENGVCRLVWIGQSAGEGLAVEVWDDAAQHFARVGRVGGAAGVSEVSIVELTGERAVIEWRGAERAMRAILCRGWRGPRLEAYNDAAGGTARLEYVANNGGAITATPDGAVAWVDSLASAGGGATTILWAKGTDADARATFAGAGTFLTGPGISYSHSRAVVAQLGDPLNVTVAKLASLAVADARAVPVLVNR